MLLLIKGTRAAQMLIGIVLVGAGFFVAKLLELTTLSWLLDNFINYSIIFFIVIFQHDIRRGLMRVGQNLFVSRGRYEQTFVFEEVIKATERLAHARASARSSCSSATPISVEYLNEPGVEIDAKVSRGAAGVAVPARPENKLHDGAVIIKNLRIAQAGAVLPLSANARLDKALGTRHRAAIGITEETDAVVVVVSEERGSISLCFGGNIARDLDAADAAQGAARPVPEAEAARRSRRSPKEREVPAALVELPFEKPQPPEARCRQSAAGRSRRTEDKPRRARWPSRPSPRSPRNGAPAVLAHLHRRAADQDSVDGPGGDAVRARAQRQGRRPRAPTSRSSTRCPRIACSSPIRSPEIKVAVRGPWTKLQHLDRLARAYPHRSHQRARRRSCASTRT